MARLSRPKPGWRAAPRSRRSSCVLGIGLAEFGRELLIAAVVIIPFCWVAILAWAGLAAAAVGAGLAGIQFKEREDA